MLQGMISHYRILRRLGAGGMAEVYLAQDTQLERPVALKVMSAALAKDPNPPRRHLQLRCRIPFSNLQYEL